MRTRLIEIPVCDRCQRDGQVLTVMPVTGERFTICRCPKHTEALREEGGREEAVTVRREANHKVTAQELLEAVKDHSHERPGYYAHLFDVSPQAVGKAAKLLVEQGLITMDSRRQLSLV